MLRFFLKRKTLDGVLNLDDEQIETLDVNCMELESLLSRGGKSLDSYDYTKLIGVEIMPIPELPKKEGK